MTVFQRGFFLEQNGVAPFQAKTCATHTIQLKTLIQSGHNGDMAVADQGDLHHPSGSNSYLLPGCIQSYKPAAGRASRYSGSTAAAIEMCFSVKKPLLVRAVKVIAYQ